MYPEFQDRDWRSTGDSTIARNVVIFFTVIIALMFLGNFIMEAVIN